MQQPRNRLISYAVGMDIGRTNIKLAAVSEEATLLREALAWREPD